MPRVVMKPEVEIEEDIGTFWLDSGAHSWYNKYGHGKTSSHKYSEYDTELFWDYVDDYIAFIKKWKHAIDYYANVDVIGNSEMSWKVQKYMEKQGLNPVPVIHHSNSLCKGSGLDWLKRYLKEGYEYIALGGVALTSTQRAYRDWADQMFNCICSGRQRLPSVRVHGFAMTAYKIMVRYPWWSLDSASWAKAAAFGSIYVPRTIAGKYDFKAEPYTIAISKDSPQADLKGKHFLTLSPSQGAEGVAAGYIKRWLERIEIPLGSVYKEPQVIERRSGKKVIKYKEKEWGVQSNYQARKIANLKFFQMMCDWLPEWPWPFKAEVRKGFFS